MFRNIYTNRKCFFSSFLHDFKNKALIFLKNNITTARLALTDVTHAQLLTKEVTSNKSTYGFGGPDTRIMRVISRAAFEIDDYYRIVEILHKRLSRFDRKKWRETYKALVLLEHLLTHGPNSVADEFQTDIDVIREVHNFRSINEKGFDSVRKKSERVLKLLQKEQFLTEERERCRKLTRGIEGFGSFDMRPIASTEDSEEDEQKENLISIFKSSTRKRSMSTLEETKPLLSSN